MKKNLSNFVCSPSDTINQALRILEENAKEILVVLDHAGKVKSTVTDGDIRRAFISGCTLESTLTEVISIKQKKVSVPAIIAPATSTKEELISLMKKYRIRQVPLVDKNNVFHSLVLLNELLFPEPIACCALIVAGGFGFRLRPFTEHTPKPMLPVGNRPLIQLIIDQLISCGVRDIFISTHYKSESISDYFKNLDNELISIKILTEDKPMGTAGSIALLPEFDSHLFIINGDILSKINLRKMYEHHIQNDAFLTVGVKDYKQQIPYGVVKSKDEIVLGIEEKPTSSYQINAGIYLANPSIRSFIKDISPINMTDIILKGLCEERKICKYSITDLWIDIGSITDYILAQRHITE